MAPRYDDEDFLQYIPLDHSKTIGTHQIAGALDCAWPTVNRRLTKITEETDALKVYDPDNDTYLEEETNTGRLLSFSASQAFVEQHTNQTDD